MKIKHPAIKESIFELVKTVELDIQLSDDITYPNRIEIFRDTAQTNRFRCRVWELESFRLIPSFPKNEDDEPSPSTDDIIMVERGIAKSAIASRLNNIFEVSGIDNALDLILRDLKKFLEFTTNVKAQ